MTVLTDIIPGQGYFLYWFIVKKNTDIDREESKLQVH